MLLHSHLHSHLHAMLTQADLDFQTPPWPSISQAAKDCVRQLLNVAPKARPTSSQLLQVLWRPQPP